MIQIQARASHFANWEDVFAQPGKLKLKTLKTGTIVSKLSTLFNLDNPDTQGLKDGPVTVPVLAHLLQHPEFGYFLVDTGLSSAFSKPRGSFKGILKAWFFRRYSLAKGEGIDTQLDAMNVKIAALFLTHAHEHVSGVGELPHNILRLHGDGERDENFFPLVYSDFFKQYSFQQFDFEHVNTMPVFNRAADVFGDGSFWALPTPGHTKGHVSYLAMTDGGPVLITGDACISQKGYTMGVEPGKTISAGVGRESFLKIKEFTTLYPQVRLAFGHENGEYRIQYSI
jgi:N-acyl homoserine lactone hydrolase